MNVITSFDASAISDAINFEIDAWNFPPTEWEANVVRSLLDLPYVTAKRADEFSMRRWGMLPNECHANCYRAALQSGGRIKHVTGWWPQGGNFLSHSIIFENGEFICITPSRFGQVTDLVFIPDNRIDKICENGDFQLYRDGRPIGPGVRMNPQATMQEGQRLRAALESGMDPIEILKL